MALWALMALAAQASGSAGATPFPSVTVTPKSCRFAFGAVNGAGAVLPAAIDGRK